MKTQQTGHSNERCEEEGRRNDGEIGGRTSLIYDDDPVVRVELTTKQTEEKGTDLRLDETTISKIL